MKEVCFHRVEWRKIEHVYCWELASPFHSHSCVNMTNVQKSDVCLRVRAQQKKEEQRGGECVCQKWLKRHERVSKKLHVKHNWYLLVCFWRQRPSWLSVDETNHIVWTRRSDHWVCTFSDSSGWRCPTRLCKRRTAGGKLVSNEIYPPKSQLSLAFLLLAKSRMLALQILLLLFNRDKYKTLLFLFNRDKQNLSFDILVSIHPFSTPFMLFWFLGRGRIFPADFGWKADYALYCLWVSHQVHLKTTNQTHVRTVTESGIIIICCRVSQTSLEKH